MCVPAGIHGPAVPNQDDDAGDGAGAADAGY